MADTTFVNKITPITAEWLNDVNDAVYGPTYPATTFPAKLSDPTSVTNGAGLVGSNAIALQGANIEMNGTVLGSLGSVVSGDVIGIAFLTKSLTGGSGSFWFAA